MKVTLSPKAVHSTLIIPLTKESLEKLPDFGGDPGEITVRYENRRALIYCGMGDRSGCTPSIVRNATAKGIQKALELKRTSASLVCTALKELPLANEAAVEGVLLGSYTFSRYKTSRPPALSEVTVTDSALNAERLREITAICTAVGYARDCVNENASVITPVWFEQEARRLSKKGLRVTVINEKQMAAQGLNLIRGVGQGSTHPPRLIFLEYRGAPGSKNTIALAGKGITFDSGGQNLKPTGHIETMRMDMAGAAAVLGVMKILTELKLKLNVIGCIAAAHNAIGSKACFPGDILKSYEGKTVEICNTDAEGRLVLADAIAFCRKRFNPSRIIDLATLTGGILTALGEQVAGLFSNDDTLANALFTAGEQTGERLWRFPLYQEYRDSLKSDLADLRNISKFKKGYASSITGAAFIQEFVGDTPWAHLDIAGTAWNEGGARGDIPQFATGFGVRLLYEYLRQPHVALPRKQKKGA